MGVLEKISRKKGVIVGDDVLSLFKYAQEQKFAIPSIVSQSLTPQWKRSTLYDHQG
jgi:hypothetical protein